METLEPTFTKSTVLTASPALEKLRNDTVDAKCVNLKMEHAEPDLIKDLTDKLLPS
jgi:hypothetical protein